MSSILRSLIVRVGADTTKAQSEFKKLAGQLKKQGKEIESAGKSLTRGITVPILGAVAGMGALVASALKTADEFQKLSDVTGLTTERLQELKYAGTKLDVELETITGAQSKLIRAMNEAKKGSGDQADAFKMLGVAVTDSNGNLRDSNVVFAEAIDALGKMENPTERDAAALKLFGKSALELNPLIKAGGDELARLTDEAHKNGAVMSGESIQALDEFGDEIEAMKLSIQTAAQQIAVDMLPTLKKLFESVKTNVLPMIKKFFEWIGKLVDGFANLSPKMQKIVGLGILLLAALGPIVTAVGKLNIGLAGMFTAVNNAIKVLKGGGGLISALSALIGPAGVVILAVAAIGALVAIFLSVNAEAMAATDRIKDLARAMDETTENYQKNSEEIETNAEVATDLVNQLYDLADVENKSNTEKEKMKSLVNQINQLMPELNLQIDEQTGLLNQNKEAVLNYVDAKKKELEARANEEYLLQLYKDRKKLQEELTTATERHQAAIKKFGEGKLVGNELKLAKKAVDILTEALRKNGIAISNSESDWIDMTQTIKGSPPVIPPISTSSIDNVTAATVDMAVKTKEKLDALKTDWLNYSEQVKSTTKDYIDAMGDLGDDGIQETELTADQIKKNLDKQIEMFKNWRKNIQLLSSKVPKDVMDELEALGPEFAPVIEQLNGMTKAELDAWIATWREKTGLARDTAINEMGPLPSKMKQIGRLSGQGFIDGMNEKLAELETCATKFGSVVTRRLENVLEIKSPSRVMKKLGKFTGLGFVGGILDTVKNVKNAALTMADATNVLGASPFKSSAVNASASGTTNNTSGMYTLNVNGSTDPNMVAGIVVQKLRMAGAV